MATTRLALELLAKNKTGRTLAGFNRQIGGTTRTLRRLAGAALAVGGVAGFGYMIKQQMAAIDTTAKLSDRLGMTIEALVGLQHGAKIAGVDTETLNKSLEMFSRRLGEVDMGVGQAKYALDKLGLNYKALIDKSPDAAIGIVADQINSLRTQAEKAAAANYLFGRSGQKLLNLFEKGSTGIRELRAEAVKLGLAFDRIDAAKVEAANDALTRVKALFTGLFRQATIELAPYIEAAAGAFTKWAISGEGAGEKVVAVFEQVSLAVVSTAAEIENAIRKMDRYTSPIEHAAKVKSAEHDAYARVLRESKRSYPPPGPDSKYGSMSAENRFKGEDWALYNRLLAEEKQRRGIGPVKGRESVIREKFEQIRRGAEAAAPVAPQRPQFGGMNLQTGRSLPSLDQRRSPMSREGAAAGRIAESTAIVSAREQARNMARLREEAARTAAEAAQMGEFAADRIQGAFRSMEWSLGGVFARMRQEGESFGETMKHIAVDIGDAFLQMAGQIMVRQAMVGMLGQTNFNNLMGIKPQGKYQGGTDYVPRAGMYMLHGGERIVPSHESAVPQVIIENRGAPVKQSGPPIIEGNAVRVMVENALAESYDQGGLMRDIQDGRRG